MKAFEFERAILGGTMCVEIEAGRVVTHKGSGRQEMACRDIAQLRWFSVGATGQRHCGLALEDARGGKLLVSCSPDQISAEDRDAFLRAIAVMLAAISAERPDLMVQPGVSRAAAWTSFLAFLVPGAMGLMFGFVMSGEPGAGSYALAGLGLGAWFSYAAWSVRPWHQEEPLPVSELSAILSGLAAEEPAFSPER